MLLQSEAFELETEAVLEGCGWLVLILSRTKPVRVSPPSTISTQNIPLLFWGGVFGTNAGEGAGCCEGDDGFAIGGGVTPPRILESSQAPHPFLKDLP